MHEERDYGILESCEETICRDIIDIKVRDYKIRMLYLNTCYYIWILAQHPGHNDGLFYAWYSTL